MSFYKCSTDTFQLLIDLEQTIDKVLYPNESQLWLFTRTSIYVWDLDTQQRIFQKSSPFLFQYKYISDITYVNKKTIMLKYGTYKNQQQIYRIIKYDIQDQKIQQIAVVNYEANTHVKMIYFAQTDTLNFVLSKYKNQIQYLCDQNLKIYFKNKFIKRSYKYNESGKICSFCPQLGHSFKLLSKHQKSTYHLQGMDKNLWIRDIKRQSDSQAVIDMSNENKSLIIFYNTQTSNIFQKVQLSYYTIKLFYFHDVWFVKTIVQQNDDYPKKFVQINDDSKYFLEDTSLRDSIFEDDSTMLIVIYNSNKQNRRKKFKRVKLILQTKYCLIHLLESSKLVKLFGNEIVKEVVNHSI